MKPIKIGIAGLGNVGEEVAYQLIKGFRVQNDQFKIELHGISAKSKDKKRKIDTENIPFFDDPVSMSNSPDIDVIVELIGGDEGVAKDLCFSALNNKKGLITANKALIAKYGKELAEIAEDNNLFFSFEASVAGGIPILKLIREGLIVNDITKVTGILNGTANYILSEMELNEKDFDEVLVDAQKKGYAEADPSFDIDGIDAAHKTIILSGLAYGKMPDVNNLSIKGIRNIVAGEADVLLVPSVETGNGLVKMMIYFMGACAAGVVVGGKVPVVITSRADSAPARLASIAAAIVAL